MKFFTRPRYVAGLLFVLAIMGQASAQAYTNPPLPYESGESLEVCDVRNGADYGASDAPVEKSLRHRVDLFNGEASGGPQKCVFGIYFLDPYTITLKSPLKISGLKHNLNIRRIYFTI